MTMYRINNLTEFEARPSNPHYIRGIEQKEVVIGLSSRRRTGATVSQASSIKGRRSLQPSIIYAPDYGCQLLVDKDNELRTHVDNYATIKPMHP